MNNAQSIERKLYDSWRNSAREASQLHSEEEAFCERIEMNFSIKGFWLSAAKRYTMWQANDKLLIYILK